MALTKINNNTLSAVTGLPAAIATGKVLQMITTESSTEVSQTSSNTGTIYYNNNLSANITPSSSSNKIIAYGDFNVRADQKDSNTDLGLALAFKSVVGGSTTVHQDASHAYHSGLYIDFGGTAFTNIRERLVKTKIIQAGTTSQMTWTMGAFFYSAGTIWMNDGNSKGRIILYEVEA
jgi:hypothetical protein